MIRKPELDRGGGRRPLLAAFVGNNRQMLNDIRDSLSHLRKSQLEGDGDGNMQIKTELSQSTPNLADKSPAPPGTKKGLENHHKTLAEIREALRPFQTGRDRSQGSSDGDVTRHKIQQVMALGVDEDIAVRALKLCNNVDGAVQLLCHIIESRNGSSKVSAGLPSYPMNRRPSFESKYGPSSPAASETNSVRSDSPSLSNVPVAARQSLVNGHQTPPPLPPRAPITSHGAPHPPARGHTPPPLSAGEGGAAALNGVGPQASSADIPPGHVQQLIKRMSPGQFRSQVVHSSPQPSAQGPGGGGGNVSLQQRGVGPMGGLPGRQTLVTAQAQGHSHGHSAQAVTGALGQGHSHGHGPTSAQAVTGALAQQLQQNLAMAHQSVNSASGSGNSSASSTPAPSGPRVTINFSHPPPPPYSQAQAQAQARGGTPTLVHIQAEQTHLLNPQLTEYLALASPDSPLNLSTASSSAASAFSDNSSGLMNSGGQVVGTKMGHGFPVTADRRLMAPHAPIIMQSVKSKEVHKPVPQTATVPPPPSMVPPAAVSQHNYISQVQVNMSAANGQVPSPATVVTAAPAPATTTTTTHTPNLQIQITGHAPHHVVHSHPHNGLHYATEPKAPHSNVHSRPTIQIHIPSRTGVGHPYPGHVHLQNLQGGMSYDLYHRAASDNLSTSRSDSPVSRATNQSPLSVLSTTSSPSTNSDIPDKPPPPYPYPGLHSVPRQPPLPPRVPLQNKPPPPPPPGSHGVTLQLPTKTVTAANQTKLAGGQMSVSPHPGLGHLPVSSQNGQAAGSNDAASEQGEDTDTETISSSEQATASGGMEKHRCMSPIPERRPDAWERDKLRCDTKLRNYSPQAFKFYMEQHVENVLKIHQQRLRRRTQLENEMAKVNLSEEASRQMRRMLHQKESNYIRLKRAKMDKSMFDKIKTLGVGAFGEVALCRKKDTGMLYAMKTLRKSDVLKRNQVAHVKAERDILAEADNEWVVKLYYSFQDHNFLYFVMDYVPGGDLMGLLIRMEILDEPLARFYVAELVQAIESVHRMGFIHRDIKPDNILIDRNGHIKLTDFGLCTGFRWTHNSKYYQKDGTHARQDSMEVKCQLDEQCQCEILKPLERRRIREQRCLAHSLVGTPNYIAPEVLLRSAGYTSVCDWWSVGVILFEMLVGHPPFYANTPAETQYKVINWKDTLKIPRESNLTQPAKDLIVRLCCGPEERLGGNGAGEIKAHPFFHGINFDSLRKQLPPYVPNIRYATDTSNFDPVDPEKLRNSESEESKKVEKLENGKHPEHAFFEFTFRRFFDDGGHPMAATLEDADTNAPVYV